MTASEVTARLRATSVDTTVGDKCNRAPSQRHALASGLTRSHRAREDLGCLRRHPPSKMTRSPSEDSQRQGFLRVERSRRDEALSSSPMLLAATPRRVRHGVLHRPHRELLVPLRSLFALLGKAVLGIKRATFPRSLTVKTVSRFGCAIAIDR